MDKGKFWKGAVVVAIILALLTLLTNLVVPFEDPLSRGTSAGVYRAPGGDKLIIQSNGQLWVTPGATVSLGGSTFGDNSTFNDAVLVQATPATTATPQVLIKDVAAGVPFEIRNASATPMVAVDGAYNLDLNVGLDVDGTSNLDEVDIDGVMNLVVGTEHIGAPSIVSTAITYTAAAGGTGTVATIGAGEIWLVHAVLVRVTTNFDCTGDDATLVVGDGNDADGFIVLADAELQAADTEGTGFAAGWQGLVPATQGVYIDAAAGSSFFVYAPSGSETIDWLVDESSGETLTAGAATIYVVYTRIQ